MLRKADFDVLGLGWGKEPVAQRLADGSLNEWN